MAEIMAAVLGATMGLQVISEVDALFWVPDFSFLL